MSQAESYEGVNGGDLETRTLLASIPLGSSCSSVANLSWSELGQALIVTDEILFILSPLLHSHPKVAVPQRLSDVESHPDWKTGFPHASCQINIKTFLENDPTIRHRYTLEGDYSDSHPIFLNARWKAASWSKPGMGPNGSCLILAITSELDLYVIGAAENSWTGDWKLFHAVEFDLVSASIVPEVKRADLDVLERGDKWAFTPSRALIRKKQRVTEVTCATWADAPLLPRRHPLYDQTLDATRPASAYIVAGTRAGHIVTFECQALTGRTSFSSTTRVSRWSIDRLLLGTQPGIVEEDAQARIAFQDVDGIHLCNLYALEDHAVVELSNAQPTSIGYQMVSNWKWFDHQLVFCTVGKAHVYDCRDGVTSTSMFGSSSALPSDPFLSAISITHGRNGDQFNIILQDLYEYEIPSRASASNGHHAPTKIMPKAPIQMRGYPPLIEELQRQHDSMQKHHAFEPRPIAADLGTHTYLLGSVLMDQNLASLGFKVSETSKFHLILVQHSTAASAGGTDMLGEAPSSAARVYKQTLSEAAVWSERGGCPATAIDDLIAVFWTEKVTKGSKRALISQIITELDSGSSTPGALGAVKSDAERIAQKQAQYCLLLWFTRHDDGTNVEEISECLSKFRTQVITGLLHAWLPFLSREEARDSAQASRSAALRLLAASYLINPDSTVLQEARGQALQALRLSENTILSEWREQLSTGQIQLDEPCAACGTKLSLSLDQKSGSFLWAVCENSHVWPRCAVTLAAISDRRTRVCPTCWTKSLVVGAEGQSPAERTMLEEASRCVYCGSCWILL